MSDATSGYPVRKTYFGVFFWRTFAATVLLVGAVRDLEALQKNRVTVVLPMCETCKTQGKDVMHRLPKKV